MCSQGRIIIIKVLMTSDFDSKAEGPYLNKTNVQMRVPPTPIPSIRWKDSCPDSIPYPLHGSSLVSSCLGECLNYNNNMHDTSSSRVDHIYFATLELGGGEYVSVMA